MSMLDELAAKAKAMVLAERPTQPATGIDGLDSLEDFSWTMAGHVGEKLAFTDEKGQWSIWVPEKKLTVKLLSMKTLPQEGYWSALWSKQQ